MNRPAWNAPAMVRRPRLLQLCVLACAAALLYPASSEALHSQALLEEILAAREKRAQAISTSVLQYRVRAMDGAWHAGFWSSAPNGDVHALGPLPPHPLFEGTTLWPVDRLTHEVRHGPGIRIWARDDAQEHITEVTIEPSATTPRERIAGHPLVYDLVVDRWLAMDQQVSVQPGEYKGQPAAYVRSAYGAEAWLLKDAGWAVVDMRDKSGRWRVKATGFDYVPELHGTVPLTLEWRLQDEVILEVEIGRWERASMSAAFEPSIEIGTDTFHVLDRRATPARSVELGSLAAVRDYLQGVTKHDPVEQPYDNNVTRRIPFVIDSQDFRSVFTLDDLPRIKFSMWSDDNESFGYFEYGEPRLEPFSPLQPGDVILTIDREEWRPQAQADIDWLLGRLTWMFMWDRPFTMTILRNGELLEYEFVWSHDEAESG